MRSWFVYILRCSDGTYYTGITNNLKSRCTKHNRGVASKYTRRRQPSKIIYFEKYTLRSEALKREGAIKKLSHNEKLKLACDLSAKKGTVLPKKLFTVLNEGFTCDNCGAKVKPTTCGTPRNHCPLCLYSKHIDINVGDRSNPCQGEMEPVGIICDSRKNYIIVHKCRRCGELKRSKAIPPRDIEPDDFDLIVKLSTIPNRSPS